MWSPQPIVTLLLDEDSVQKNEILCSEQWIFHSHLLLVKEHGDVYNYIYNYMSNKTIWRCLDHK